MNKRDKCLRETVSCTDSLGLLLILVKSWQTIGHGVTYPHCFICSISLCPSWEGIVEWEILKFTVLVPCVCSLTVTHKRDSKGGLENYHGEAYEYQQQMNKERGQLWDVLVSYSCCNKLPQTWWLERMTIDSLTFLNVRSPKTVAQGWNQGISKGALSPEALGENLFPWSFPAPRAVVLAFVSSWPLSPSPKQEALAIYFSHQMLSSVPVGESPPIFPSDYITESTWIIWIISPSQDP